MSASETENEEYSSSATESVGTSSEDEDDFAEMTLREFVRHSVREADEVKEYPVPFVIKDCFRCSICLQESGPLPCRFCLFAKHILCHECFDAYFKHFQLVGSNTELCPFIYEGGEVCGDELYVAKYGLPGYLTLSYRFPCSSNVYGCTFTGTARSTLEHEVSQCPYRFLRYCLSDKHGDEMCLKKFKHPFDLVLHRMQDHGEQIDILPKQPVGIPITSNLKEAELKDSKWAPHMSTVLVWDFQKSGRQFSLTLLVVEEGDDWFRLWMTEVDPNVAPEDQAGYTITFPVREQWINGKPPKGTFTYNLELLPYLTTKLTDESKVRTLRYCEISKQMAMNFATWEVDELKFKVMVTYFPPEGLGKGPKVVSVPISQDAVQEKIPVQMEKVD